MLASEVEFVEGLAGILHKIADSIVHKSEAHKREMHGAIDEVVNSATTESDAVPEKSEIPTENQSANPTTNSVIADSSSVPTE